jgi:YHS domain-containing protein
VRRAVALCLLLGACPTAKAEGWVEPPQDGTEIVDPVSGEKCTKSPVTEAAVYKDRTHYFCGTTRGAFVTEPQRYAR